MEIFEFSPELTDLSPTKFVSIFSKFTFDPEKSTASFETFLNLSC